MNTHLICFLAGPECSQASKATPVPTTEVLDTLKELVVGKVGCSINEDEG